MFWYALCTALKVMTYWETYVVILEYLCLLSVPIIFTLFVMQKNREAGLKYVKIIFLPVLEAVAIALFVLTLYPIILGIGEEASWGFPLRIMQIAPGGFLGFLVFLMFLAIIFTFISKLSSRSQSFKTLILGGVSLIFVRIFLHFINPSIDLGITDLVPGFWFVLGMIAISGMLSKIGDFLCTSCSNILGSRYDLRDGAAELIIMPVTATLGLIPVMVYGAWLS